MNISRALVVAMTLSASLSFADEAVTTEASASAPVVAEQAATPAVGEVGSPEAGKGQVVFFRPAKMTGALIGFKVREAGKELGVLKNGNYFVLSVEPGKHEYTVRSEAKDVLALDVEAGEVYYVAGSITMGIMAGRPNLSPSTDAAFNQISDKLKKSAL